MSYKKTSGNQENAKINIGIVGKDENNYFSMGIYALQNMDEFGQVCTFTHVEKEEEIKEKLEEGTIDIYAVFPDNFIDSIIYGENKHIRVVLKGRQTPLGTKIVRDLLTGISSLITDTQAGIYSYHDFYKYYFNSYNYKIEKLEYDLNFEYAKLILNRENLFSIIEEFSEKSIDLRLHFLCIFLVFVLFLWTLYPVFLYVKDDGSMQNLLVSKGYKIAFLTLADWLSCQILLSACLILPFIFMFIKADLFDLKWSGCFIFLLRFYPLTFFISSVEICTAKFSKSLPAVLMFNFILALVIAIIPNNFFLTSVEAAISGEGYFIKSLFIHVMTLFFLFSSILLRLRRNKV